MKPDISIKRIKAKKNVVDLVADIAGSFAFAVGIYCFSEKANIAPGGISGVAIMLKYLFGLPVGVMTLVMNIPLLFVAYKIIGRKFALRTVRTLVLSTAILDLAVTPFMPQYGGDRILGAVFGGVFMGAGLGMIFLRGSTTGGVDIVSILIERKYPHIPIGKALMLIDCVILAASAFVFGDIETVLFGIISLYCQTKIIDKIVYGGSKGHQIMCISQQNASIARRVINEIGRSATFLSSKGAYSGAESSVLMCVIRAQEYSKIKRIIYEQDPKAFIIVSETSQVMGEGFKQIADENGPKDKKNKKV